jgi:hypothetical protein
MNHTHVPFWIAADLLAQAQAYGIELPPEMSQQLRGLVRDEQRGWMTGRRESEDEQRREGRRRDSTRRGWF